ncbi:MAG: shikimate dehydrogenase [Anaerohalosphaera sp.]|nr:shikimate dehydrogenase [Anaerohalosphaera sp.]
MSFLAVSIAESNLSTATGQMQKAKAAGADMLELRLDHLCDLTVERAVNMIAAARSLSLPIIATCRDSNEGGVNDYPADLRLAVLLESIVAGVDFVDCEFDNFAGETKEQIKKVLRVNPGCRLILSAHNFKGTFPDINQLYDNIHSSCPDAIPKLVYTAKHINDCFPAIDLLRNRRSDAIVLCMGNAGMMMRLLSGKFGGFLSFASLDPENATAPGQITIDDMIGLYRWRSINSDTLVYGVIGSPVGHSISPAVFNACFDKDGINAVYLPLLVDGQSEQFDEFLHNIISRHRQGDTDFGGFSVTIPHKANALEYAERKGQMVEPLAINIGAANTIRIGLNGSISLYNTDYAGAIDALADAIGVSRHGLHSLTVAVIGAGGAGRAIVAGLVDVGAKVTIYNRTLQKAIALADEFGCKYAPAESIDSLTAQVIVNCTSIGMYPNTDASPVPAKCLKPAMTVFDTVYNPLQTMLLTQAKAAGANVVSGDEMFVRQAMAQYKIFTGQTANENIMRKTVLAKLGK